MSESPQAIGLKFLIGETSLKRRLIMLLSGMPAIPTNDAQAQQLAQLDRFLADNVHKMCEWGIDFGAMYSSINPERMAQIVDFIREYPESVHFDNLNPLRERMASFLEQLQELATLLKPEQFDHKAPTMVIPNPSDN